MYSSSPLSQILLLSHSLPRKNCFALAFSVHSLAEEGERQSTFSVSRVLCSTRLKLSEERRKRCMGRASCGVGDNSSGTCPLHTGTEGEGTFIRSQHSYSCIYPETENTRGSQSTVYFLCSCNCGERTGGTAAD